MTMMRYLLSVCLLIACSCAQAQQRTDSTWSFAMGEDTKITIDAPASGHYKNSILICFALPNGNTTEQTMGRRIQPGDDFRYDIQHIRAQTVFIRKTLPHTRVTVAYFENSLKSWPAWKLKHSDYALRVKTMVDTVYALLADRHTALYLNGHSGGGRFIFSYLDAVPVLPSYVQRISFLDSDYGYDSSYFPKLRQWLTGSRKNYLSVFAYNDSVALYEGKRVVSDTGGTWYRTHRMMQDLQSSGIALRQLRDDSLQYFSSDNGRILFFLKTNPEKKIYHTVQVERNGFIHSVLCGTKYDSKDYIYYGSRAYVPR